MNKEHWKTLVSMIGSRLETESSFSSPQPQIFMRSPYDLLDWINAQELLTAEEIDEALVKGQEFTK